MNWRTVPESYQTRIPGTGPAVVFGASSAGEVWPGNGLKGEENWYLNPKDRLDSPGVVFFVSQANQQVAGLLLKKAYIGIGKMFAPVTGLSFSECPGSLREYGLF